VKAKGCERNRTQENAGITGLGRNAKRHCTFVEPLLIGCFRLRRFLITWKSRPEFENQVPNPRKDYKDKLSWRST
jgi:hypothetical protein